MPINPLGIIPNSESSNCTDNYTTLSTSSGCFGFLDSTWKSAAQDAGIDTTLYPRAADAPVSSQFAAAAALINKNGLKDWTCSGCNAKFSATVDAAGGVSAFQTSGLSTNPADYADLDTASGLSAYFSAAGSTTGSTGVSVGSGGSTLSIAGTSGQTALAGVSSQGGVLDRPFTWAYTKLITNTQTIVSAEIAQTQAMVATYITPMLIIAVIAIGIRSFYGR